VKLFSLIFNGKDTPPHLTPLSYILPNPQYFRFCPFLYSLFLIYFLTSLLCSSFFQLLVFISEILSFPSALLFSSSLSLLLSLSLLCFFLFFLVYFLLSCFLVLISFSLTALALSFLCFIPSLSLLAFVCFFLHFLQLFSITYPSRLLAVRMQQAILNLTQEHPTTREAITP